MRIRPRAIAFALLAACGCSRRPHVTVHGDGGPSVVVVDRRPDAGAAAARGGGAAAGFGLADVALVDEKEPDDDLGRAQPLEYPRGIRGTLAGAAPGKPDVDVFQWIPSPAAGGEPRLRARVELAGPADATLDVLDKNGAPLLRALPGEHVLPNLAVTAGEVLFVRVRGGRSSWPAAGGATSPAAPAAAVPGGDYRLAVRTAPLLPGDEEEPNDSAERANALAPAVEESGFHGRPHDEDWLRLPGGIPAGSTLRLELSPVEGVTPSLRVRDAAGSLLLEARGGRGEELRLRNAPVPSGGLLVVRAESGRNLDIPWRLRLAVEAPLEGAEVEPNNAESSANPLGLDGIGSARVAGFLWPGDTDYYRVEAAGPGLLEAVLELPAGVEGRVEAVAAGTKGAAAARGAEGGGARSRRVRALPEGGACLFRVSARPRDTAFEAPYTLTVTQRAAVPGVTPGAATADDSAPGAAR